MEILDSIFSSESEVIEKLRGYAQKPDYKKIFFDHLGPELKKYIIQKKIKYSPKIF